MSDDRTRVDVPAFVRTSELLSPSLIKAYEGHLPPAFIASHELLRKYARMGWQAAMALGTLADTSHELSTAGVDIDVILEEP